MVSAFAVAVPLLPLQVQRLVGVPRFAGRLIIGRDNAVFDGILFEGASPLAFFHARSGKRNKHMRNYLACRLFAVVRHDISPKCGTNQTKHIFARQKKKKDGREFSPDPHHHLLDPVRRYRPGKCKNRAAPIQCPADRGLGTDSKQSIQIHPQL